MRAVHVLQALSVAVLVASAAHAAPAPSYLFDVLHRPTYRAAWDRMLQHQAGLPRWLAIYARGLDGPATPGVVRTVGGRPREFYHVCEAHNCADSQFEVMFSDDGSEAKGLLTVAGDPPRYYGGPDAAERRALASANDE